MLSLRMYQSYRTDVQSFGSVLLWLGFRCVPTLVGVCLVLLVLSAATAHAENGEAVRLNDVGAGQLLLREEGGGYTRALIQSSRVHFDISGMVAVVTLQQTFRNTSSDYVEGVYAFPLPDDAAVRAMEMQIGERRIVGKISEKQAAKKVYAAAKKAGKKASLVEQQRPNLFTNRVANIGPGEEVSIQLEYIQSASYLAGQFSLRFPTTITPRYMPGALLRNIERDDIESPLSLDTYLGWALPTQEVQDAHAISPLLHPLPGADSSPVNAIEITATLDMGMPLAEVSSPYHEIALSRRAGIYNIQLANGSSEMDRDFVLDWQPVAGSAPEAALFTEVVDGQYYGLLMVVPPAKASTLPTVPREVIFVVDTSGSMGGVSIEQARASLGSALRQLSPQDHFNIIEFDSSYRDLFGFPVPATRHNIERALSFVGGLNASGGTEMRPALRAALKTRSVADEIRALRQIVFITDGAVGNEEALYREISEGLGESRLFTVGIGSAPNSWFMRKAAEFGRGTHTHIGDLSEVGDKMARLFEQLARPAAVDFSIQWPLQVESWPARIPDLYAGEPLTVAVSFGDEVPVGDVLVQGRIGDTQWARKLHLTGSPAGDGRAGVGSLWAQRKISHLLDEKVRGRAEEEVRAEVLPLALAHSLMSPYTSFVAVEEVVSRPATDALKAKPVPNTAPRGQTAQSFAFPQTATTGPAKIWFGLLLSFAGVLVRLLRQPEVDRVSSSRA